MSEEEKTTPSQKAGADRKGKPITHYLMILFAAALALLLISFFMQQRNHQVLLELNDSMVEQQATLQTSKEQLQLQVTDLQKKLEEEKADLDKAQSQTEEAQQQAQALEWLRQIQQTMSHSYQEAAQLRDAFEAAGLADKLPDTSAVEGKSSPAQDYRDLCERLPE